MHRHSFAVYKCAIAGVEAMEASSDRTFARHSHNSFAIGEIISGAQKSWSGSGRVEAGAGDMISSNPGEVHDGSPVGASRTWKILYISPELMGSAATDIGEGRPGDFEFTSPVFERSPSTAAFERCYASMTDRDADPLRAESEMLRMIGRLSRRIPRSMPANELSRIRDLIDTDPTVSVTLGELAREVGLSRFQTLRGFMRLTGLPPHAYRMQRRLDAARRLIAGGSSLSETALATGFSDQSHLHRMFVRRFGFTPGAYASAFR